MTEQSNVFEVGIDPDISKAEYYNEKLGGIVPEAFFVFGGGNRKIEKNEEKGRHKDRYTTSAYKGKFFPAKIGGAKARPVAASELSQFYPKATIVTMSHRPLQLFQLTEETTPPSNSPPFSAVLEEDLKRLKVRNEIIQETQSTSTLTEIMEVLMLSAENDWNQVAVVTNDYQIERAKKILDILKDEEKRLLLKNQLQFLFESGEETDLFNQKWEKLEGAVSKTKSNDKSIVFVSAEAILRKRNPHYNHLMEQLVNLGGYKNVIQQEMIGNQKIDEGSYNFAQPSFREYVLSDNSA